MVMDFGAFATLLDERYREIIELTYQDQRDMVPRFYNVKDSDRQTERVSSVGELGEWQQMNGQIGYDRLYQQYNTQATHLEFALGMLITRRLYDDDLSGVMQGDKFRQMVRSERYTRQAHAARFLNFATSNDSFFYTRSEAVALASASHTTATPGVSTTNGFSNISTSALSPTSYRAARIQMRKFRNDRGQLANIDGDLLVTGLDLEPVAQEIVGTAKQVDTNYNNVNPEYKSAEVIGWNQFTSTTNWALINKALMKENLIWWDRVKPDYESIKDFETKQIKWSGYMRYSVMLLDWRWILFASVG